MKASTTFKDILNSYALFALMIVTVWIGGVLTYEGITKAMYLNFIEGQCISEYVSRAYHRVDIQTHGDGGCSLVDGARPYIIHGG
jgi:hypothetical protein